MHFLSNPNLWAVGPTAIVQLVLFLRWLHRRVRNNEQNRAFVRDMATNHLPHIYDLLVKLAEQQGIEVQAPPPIRWIDFGKR
jgi:hypothetical protein